MNSVQTLDCADRRECAADARLAARTNIFLSAILEGAGFSSPVKIRNMSVQGALIEAPAVPSPGSTVRLARGSLEVPCVVVWASGGRCGLRLSSQVSVRDWMAPPANRQQHRVDELVRLVKSGAQMAASGQGVTNSSIPASAFQLAEDLRRVYELIERLGDRFARDEIAVSRFGADLQHLDIALQTISAVADHLASERPNETATRTRLTDPRANCRAALEQGSGR